MFKNIIEKIKLRKELKEAKKSLEIVLMQKLNEIADKELERQTLENEILAQTKELNDGIDVEEQKKFMAQLSEFMESMKNPQFSDKFFETIQQRKKDA